MIGLLGLAVFTLLAWLAGRGRGRCNFRVLGWGLALQLLFGLFVFRTGAGQSVLLAVIASRAFVAATIACLMTGCVAGMFAGEGALVLGGR